MSIKIVDTNVAVAANGRNIIHMRMNIASLLVLKRWSALSVEIK